MHTRLRQLRKSAGLTQAQLVAKAGVRQQDISRWERGLILQRDHTRPSDPAYGNPQGSDTTTEPAAVSET